MCNDYFKIYADGWMKRNVRNALKTVHYIIQWMILQERTDFNPKSRKIPPESKPGFGSEPKAESSVTHTNGPHMGHVENPFAVRRVGVTIETNGPKARGTSLLLSSLLTGLVFES